MGVKKKKKKVVSGKKKGVKKKKGKASILKPSATARQRQALIDALQKGRSSGSLVGAPPDPAADAEDARSVTMASPSVRSRAGSVASRARSRAGSVAFGSPSRARSVAMSTSPTKRKKSALAKSKAPTSQQLAQQLFAATTDTALGAEVQILRAALSTLTNTVVEEVGSACGLLRSWQALTGAH